MYKKALLICLIIFLVSNVLACSKAENDVFKNEASTTATPTHEETKTYTPETLEKTTDDKTEEIEEDPAIFYLKDGSLIFIEKTEDMAANFGAYFSDVFKKESTKDGFNFTFKPNDNEHLQLLTRLDEFDGAIPLFGQAVFIKFKTTTTGIYFSFLGDNDFGVYFGDKDEPLVFTYTESDPFSFDGDLKLITDTWYCMLMAMDEYGVFNCIIYQDDKTDIIASVSVSLGETGSGKGYKNQSWQFEIATHEEGTVSVEQYRVYTYETFKIK